MRSCAHAFMRSCGHTFIHSYVLAFMRSYIYTFLRSCAHGFIHLYIHSYVLAFMWSYIHTLMRSCAHAFIHLYIHTFLRSCGHAHSYIHTFIHAGGDDSSLFFFLENKIPRSGDSQLCGTIQILGWISIIAIHCKRMKKHTFVGMTIELNQRYIRVNRRVLKRFGPHSHISF